MRVYREKTADNGVMKICYASDNFAQYQLTSAMAKDAYTTYCDKYEREPSSAWYNRHFRFERIK